MYIYIQYTLHWNYTDMFLITISKMMVKMGLALEILDNML